MIFSAPQLKFSLKCDIILFKIRAAALAIPGDVVLMLMLYEFEDLNLYGIIYMVCYGSTKWTSMSLRRKFR